MAPLACSKTQELHYIRNRWPGAMSESNIPNRPLISVAIRPRPHSDLWKLQRALSYIVQEDPAMKVETEPGDGSILISGTSDLHLETICARIVQEGGFKVEVQQISRIDS